MKAAASSWFDQPGGVRPGEELDVARVDAAIQGVVKGLTGPPKVREYPGGASNLTYLLIYPEREFVLRRPPFGTKAKSAHDMKREATILSALGPVYRGVPKVVAFFDDPAILGCDFYLMQPIHGIIVRQDFPPDLALTPDDARRLCHSLLDKLIALHKLDYKAVGLDAIAKGEGYVQRQIEGWNDRYRRARTDDVPDCERTMKWLQERIRPDAGACVIHNDFRFDNVVLDPADPFEVIGVLDWEMATVGDPLMDLGNALAYWVQADDDAVTLKTRKQPTHLPGMLTRKEVIAYYGAKTGRDVGDFDFYIVYGLFRLAVIIQQIYYRYYHGQTKNPAFAGFGQLVHHLERRCFTLIAGAKS